MAIRQGLVRIDGKDVGRLTEREEGYVFEYFDSWCRLPETRPISLTLPVRAEPYVSRNLHPYFQNLLPEGWLLELATKKLKISKDDAFGLLLATCADCIGAVEIIDLAAGEEA